MIEVQKKYRIEEMSDYENEVKDIIPQSVINALKGSGLSTKYLYKEENIPNPPSSNVSQSQGKNHRFGNLKTALPYKTLIGSTGWVYFQSPSHSGMINRNRSSSVDVNLKYELKAEKHTSILCKTQDIFENIFPNFKTYLTVHRIGNQTKFYREAEKKTNRTFYHLTMLNQHPDAIIVEKDVIRYVVEVKWGYLEDFPDETDLLFPPNQFVQNSCVCRVIGPYIQNGIELNGQEIYDFKVNQNTRFIVVSDLRSLKNSSFVKEINRHQLFSICDINNNTDAYKSLETYLRMQ